MIRQDRRAGPLGRTSVLLRTPDRTAGAICESESSLFKGLRRHFRSSVLRVVDAAPKVAVSAIARSSAPKGRRPGPLRLALDEAEKRVNRNLHFAKRNQPFRGHAVSHWNHYERRIRHFAGLFVFKGLAPFSFRRFRGMFVFNDLALLPVSPRNSPSPGAPSPIGVLLDIGNDADAFPICQGLCSLEPPGGRPKGVLCQCLISVY